MKKGELRMQIKFVDLAAMNDEIRERVDREMAEIHQNTAYIGGPHVEAFEKEFADFLGVRHVIGVGSGTDALRLALMAHDVGPGDEVITTPMTFIATAASIGKENWLKATSHVLIFLTAASRLRSCAM